MRLLFIANHKISASTYYRQDVPYRSFNTLGLAQCEQKLWGDLGDTLEERWKNILTAQGLFYYIQTGPTLLKMLKKIAKFPAEPQERGIAYPPAMFEDTDDNTHWVQPVNPRFDKLGTRIMGPNGKVHKLVKGDVLEVPLHDGTRHVMWKDGENGLDVERNHKLMWYHDRCLKQCHGVSVSTQRLKDYYTKVLKLKNVYVYPNSVAFEDYPDIPIQRTKGNVKVLWQGGDSHYGDWFSIRPVLKPLSEKFPELKWMVWGVIYPFVHREIPRDQLQFIDWLPYDAYKIRLATLDFDFAVAPLVENPFNICKSAIKFYEAAALPRPKPVLAARVSPYSDEIIDGETGMLYGSLEEFQEKFEALVRDGDLRERLAANAKDWVNDNRYALKTAGPYFEWICSTIGEWQRSKRADGGLPEPSREADMPVVHP